MKNHWQLGRLAACALLVGLVTGCGGKAGKGSQQSHGTIREINPIAGTLVLREKLPSKHPNEELRLYRTYKVAFDCKIKTATKEKAELSDLKINDKVNVHYAREGDTFVLREIEPRLPEPGGEKKDEKKDVKE